MTVFISARVGKFKYIESVYLCDLSRTMPDFSFPHGIIPNLWLRSDAAALHPSTQHTKRAKVLRHYLFYRSSLKDRRFLGVTLDFSEMLSFVRFCQ